MKKQKVEQKNSELAVNPAEIDRKESGLNHQITEAEVVRVQKTQKTDKNKRILITGVNSLVGHGLFE